MADHDYHFRLLMPEGAARAAARAILRIAMSAWPKERLDKAMSGSISKKTGITGEL